MPLEYSALIRTYNSAQTLDTCLESLSAQTLPPERIIVVDSGSTDDTLEIARAHGAAITHYPDEEEFNYSRALNIGMEHVETSHALIISSHVSLPDPDTLRILACLLKADDRRCAASITGRVESPSDTVIGEKEWTLVTRDNFISRYGGMGISNSCNLIPTKLWNYHRFDEGINRCEDQKWLLYYLKKNWNAARIKKPHILYRNPNYSIRKDIGDIMAMALYEINPTLVEIRSILNRVKNCLHYFARGEYEQATRSARIVRGLIRIRFGMEKKVESKYL